MDYLGTLKTTLGENFYEELLSALSNTLLDGILFLIGIVAIVLDFFHPTIVLTILGVIAIVAGLVGAEVVGASLLGIIILIVAAALIVVELKLGHGFALMAGVVLGAIGIYFLSFNLQYSPSPIGDLAILELSLVVVFGVLAGLYIRWVIGPIRRRTKLTGAEALDRQNRRRHHGIETQRRSQSGRSHLASGIVVRRNRERRADQS